MKKRLTFGGIFVLLGLLIAFGPFYLFRVCDVNGISDLFGGGMMHCNHTANWEFVVGLAIVVLAILSIIINVKGVQIALYTLTLISGILALLLPTTLTGVCADPHMHCHAITLPALIILSAIVIVLSVAQLLFAFKAK
jgi:hypothetical protein